MISTHGVDDTGGLDVSSGLAQRDQGSNASSGSALPEASCATWLRHIEATCHSFRFLDPQRTRDTRVPLQRAPSHTISN